MSISQEVCEIEEDLAKRGWSPDDLCRAASINRSTWTRWKSGAVAPNLATWQRVKDSLSTFDRVKSDQAIGQPDGSNPQVAAV